MLAHHTLLLKKGRQLKSPENSNLREGVKVFAALYPSLLVNVAVIFSFVQYNT